MRYVAITTLEKMTLTIDSIGKSDDEVGRMLEILRFWFTKDLVQSQVLAGWLKLTSDRNT